MSPLEKVLAAIDAVNEQDPQRDVVNDSEQAHQWRYSRLLVAALRRLNPQPSEERIIEQVWQIQWNPHAN